MAVDLRDLICSHCGHPKSQHETWWGGCSGTWLGDDSCLCSRFEPETDEQQRRREAQEERCAFEDCELGL